MIQVEFCDTKEVREFASLKEAHIAVSNAFQREIVAPRAYWIQLRCDAPDRSGLGCRWFGSKKITGTAAVGASETLLAVVLDRGSR